METVADFSDEFELSEDELMTPLINFNMKEDEPKLPSKPNEKSNLVARKPLTVQDKRSSPLELTDIIGKSGWWQIKILLLTGITHFPTAWNHLGIAFLAYPVDHWCSRPNSSNHSLETWWTEFLPTTTIKGELHHSQCEMYYINRTTGLPDKNRIIPCDSFEFSPEYNTIVNKWNLVCSNEWLISTSQTIYMCGFLVSVLLSGHLADKYGRLPAIMLNIVILLVGGFAAAFSSTFILFTICRFFVGLGHGGLGLVGYIILLETVGSEYRVRYMFIHGFGWHIGYMLLPVIAWLEPDWFYLQIIITAPSMICLIFYWVLPESPRWLLVNGHIEKALPILEDAVRMNGLEVKDLEGQARKLVDLHFKGKEKSVTFLDLLLTPNLRMKTLCLYFIWASIAFTYYGLSLNTNSLIGNEYVNFFLSGFMEIPATLFCILTLDRCGRKKPFFVTLLFGGLACFACIFVPERYARINTGFAMIGKMFDSASFSIVYLFSSEIFPTVARNVGVGSSSTVARIGSSIAPFMRDLGNATNPAVPLALFGVLSIISALLVLKMPETNNQPVPESIEDAEKFGKTEISPVPPIQVTISEDSS